MIDWTKITDKLSAMEKEVAEIQKILRVYDLEEANQANQNLVKANDSLEVARSWLIS